LQEGKMVVEFEAPSREVLEKWLALEKFHFDWLLRLEFEFADDSLRPLRLTRRTSQSPDQ